jgi:branched-chain amino acid transport system substrate-binding protein
LISVKQGNGDARLSRRVPVVLLAAGLLAGAAACSSSSSSSGSATGSATSASGGASSASAASGSPSAALAPFLLGKKASGTPVKIGLINNEGSSAVAEPAIGDTAVAAADYANAELGGMAGHPIQVIRCAEEEDTASATACANKMVQDDVAAVVLGTASTGNTMVPIITKAGIPYVTVTGTASDELTSPGTYSWTGGFPSDLGGMAQYAAKNGIKKVTAFVVDVASAIAGAKEIGAPLFKANGVTLTIEPVPAAVPDATAQVTAGLSGQPGAAAVVADYTTCTSVLKALKVVNPTLQLMVVDSCLNSSVLSVLGSQADGIKEFGRDDINSDSPEAQLYRYVMATYSPETNTSGSADTGYQGMLGLIRATTAGGLTGTPTPASIIAAIKAAKNVPLPAGGGITFTCNAKASPTLSSVCSTADVELTVQGGKAVDPVTLSQ